MRLTSHRDLLRTVERLFRRAGIALSRSEGFHPKPRMTFPLALSLGVEGCEEVLEVELVEPLTAEEMLGRLAASAVPGLTFTSAEELPLGSSKGRVVRVQYEFPLPPARQPLAAQRIAELLAASTHRVDRPDRQTTVDIRPWIEQLEIDGETLRMTLRVSPEGTGRPREVLVALGLLDLEEEGNYLTRRRVQLDEESAGGAAAPADPLAGRLARE